MGALAHSTEVAIWEIMLACRANLYSFSVTVVLWIWIFIGIHYICISVYTLTLSTFGSVGKLTVQWNYSSLDQLALLNSARQTNVYQLTIRFHCSDCCTFQQQYECKQYQLTVFHLAVISEVSRNQVTKIYLYWVFIWIHTYNLFHHPHNFSCSS